MKIDYDPERDLMYIYFVEEIKKVAETKTVSPGIHVDFDKDGELIGIEILEASKVTGKRVEIKLPEFVPAAKY